MKTKKIPLSQRPQSEQVRYWVSSALDWLLAGAPTVASVKPESSIRSEIEAIAKKHGFKIVSLGLELL